MSKDTKLHNLDTPQALQKFECMNIIPYFIYIRNGSSLFGVLSSSYWDERDSISDNWISFVMYGMSCNTKLNGKIQSISYIKDLIIKKETWRFSENYDLPVIYIGVLYVYVFVCVGLCVSTCLCL